VPDAVAGLANPGLANLTYDLQRCNLTYIGVRVTHNARGDVCVVRIVY
jgi:hypothetical protein